MINDKYIHQHNYFDEIATKYENAKNISFNDINPTNTALIIVDMINGFTKEGKMSSPDSLMINEDIANLANICDNKGIKIVAFADCHKEDSIEFNSFPVHCLEGTSESEVTDEIKNACTYTLINKSSINGFFENNFKQFLNTNPNIDTFIVVGCCTDFCVLNFALSLKINSNATNTSRDVIVLTDLTQTFNSPTHNRDFWNVVSYSNMEQNGIIIAKNLTSN